MITPITQLTALDAYNASHQWTGFWITFWGLLLAVLFIYIKNKYE